MNKVIRNVELLLMATMLLAGVVSVIGGLMTGKVHCFFMGAGAFAIPYTWYVDMKNKDKLLWQKKNTKNSLRK